MPPRQQQHDPQFLDADHESIVRFAEQYFDDEEERASFVDTLLERRGYQRTSGWSAPAEQPPNGGGGGGQPARQPQRAPYFRR